MAPEQLEHRGVTRVSDVYAAGVVLWETIAGRRLFPSDFGDAKDRILAGVEAPPSQFAKASVDTLTTAEMAQLEALDAVAMRAMSVKPEGRYATAREMALAIESSGPLAAQSAVGGWVESLAKAELDKRAAWVRDIEALTAPDSGTLDVPPPTREVSSAVRERKRGRGEVEAAPPDRTRPLRIGEIAPDIDRLASNGRRFVLSESTRPYTVVFFFPQSRTYSYGCVREVRLFQASQAELAFAGAGVVGVSVDDHATQCAFAKATEVSYPIVPDPDGGISRAYGVLRPLLGRAKRVTFVLDRERKVLAVFRHELRVTRHRDDVLAFVDALYRSRRAE